MLAVIMAGGAGTRFWPASRAALPKQFLPILGSKSMIRLTMERLLPLVPVDKIHVVTAASQVELVKQHLPEMPVENIIIEPFGMNTAPCLALSLAVLLDRHSLEETMLVLPADHFIRDTQSFLASLTKADEVASHGRLVTFGIIPDHPATGYGYIEAGAELSPGVREVARFKEKPDALTAAQFIAQGNFYWNSGMFCWSLGTLARAFETHLPLALNVARELVAGLIRGIDEATAASVYARMPKTPIDIGIMEKATNRAVIPVNYGWSDVGGWKALADLSPTDANGNRFSAPSLPLDSTDNYISTNKFCALIGVHGLCLIETPDAILLCPKDRSEEVKQVVDTLKAQAKDNLL